MSIHQKATFPIHPKRLFDLLIDGTQFSAATGQPAVIENASGGKFSIFGGKIHGRQIELIPGRHLVPAWRMADWPSGVYSLVRFIFTPEGRGTKLIIEQQGYPEGKSPMFPTWHEHLTTGWDIFYLEPIGNYLAN